MKVYARQYLFHPFSLTCLCLLVLGGLLVVKGEMKQNAIATHRSQENGPCRNLPRESLDQKNTHRTESRARFHPAERKDPQAETCTQESRNRSINSLPNITHAFLDSHFENKMFITYNLRERSEREMLGNPALIDGLIDVLRERTIDVAVQNSESFAENPPIEVAERMVALDVIAIAAETSEHSRQGRDALAFLVEFIGENIGEERSSTARKIFYVEKMEAFRHLTRICPALSLDLLKSIKDPILRRLLFADPPGPTSSEDFPISEDE